MLRSIGLVIAGFALLLAGCGAGPVATVPTASPTPASDPAAPELPAPDVPLPATPSGVADAYAQTTRALSEAVDEWVDAGDPSHGGAPRAVTLLALHQQRLILRLARRPGWIRRTIAALPRDLRPRLRDEVRAKRALAALVPANPPKRRFRISPPEPADAIRRHYATARRRFGVAAPLLAAVHLVESQFGRMRNDSIAGAQGPMQFIPSTWAAYGLGGDIHDPRDAILGAANYLHANGAPADEARALFHYNPSSLYVEAVLRYARRMRADPRSFYGYYAWQVWVRTPRGDRRLSGPGADGKKLLDGM